MTTRAWEIGRGFVEYQVLNFTGPGSEVSIVGDRAHKSPLLPVEPDERADAAFRHHVVNAPSKQPKPEVERRCACNRLLKASDKGLVCAACRYQREKAKNIRCACGKPCLIRDNRTAASRCAECIEHNRRIARRRQAA